MAEPSTKKTIPATAEPSANQNILVGRWVTTFDALYVHDHVKVRLGNCEPSAALACWVFHPDGTFYAEKRDNKGRKEPPHIEEFEGEYTIGWHPTLGIAEGVMTFIFPAEPPPARFFIYVNLIMRDRDTFDWVMAGGFYPDDSPPAPEIAPLARGAAHRIQYLQD